MIEKKTRVAASAKTQAKTAAASSASAAKRAKAASVEKNRKEELVLPEVNFSEDGISRYLHLGTPWVQGAMNLESPFDIDLEYAQRMMAWLLFVEPQTVAKRQAMQLGLGAAALTKFCHKRLRMATAAVEINPQVVAVCRGWFKLPPDDSRLQVILGDAEQVIAQPQWQGQVDALQVDLYDHEAGAPVLDSPDFYAACRQALTDDGCMTVNLFGRMSSFDRSLSHMVAAFGEQAIWSFRPTREGNTVVLGQAQPSRPDADLLAQRAQVIQQRWKLPARKWLRSFKPLVQG